MGGYPAFLVGNFYNILQRHYGLTDLALQRETGMPAEALTRGSHDLYPNDAHTLRLIRLLDEVGFYRERELTLMGNPQQRGGNSIATPPLFKLVSAEQRNSKSLYCFLKKNRFSL